LPTRLEPIEISEFTFTVVARARSSAARAGVLHTPHGPIETPAFMPVGTLATVKAVAPVDLASIRPACVLANAYHLSLRPGATLVERLGGVHRFMNWDGPMLTDSGGYQVFSLEDLRQVDDDGVTIRSHLDGRERRLTPARVVRVEEQLGADIIMPLDVCLGPDASRSDAELALERTHRWAIRSLRSQRRHDQALFAIVQGCMNSQLRSQAARALRGESFPGFAIGGLSVGESRSVTDGLVEVTCKELPTDRPRYLMGVGEPDQLLAYAGMGVDMFDCVLPTRMGRTGYAFTSGGRVNIARGGFVGDHGPLDDACACETCARHSRAYLNHLFRSREPLGARLLSVHNVAFLVNTLRRFRRSVVAGEI
jgi:queuine tRNA-ribosyltransferase